MSSNESAPTAAGGAVTSVDALVSELKEKTGAASVFFSIQPVLPAAANDTSSGTAAGGGTSNSLEECVSHLKETTGATTVAFELKPNLPSNNNN
ncbi:hypothetical protein FGADI_12495 [Fusarium gaditjirri]|uniref:Uncharacterized protein n=1 Tax=Fusarium gaditjirri TaxID=282569 RepID=A0A8H4WP41_9HYPO|nr:hypothetical protein FGADI_12495 [Fusarium gaditjirri]